MRNRLDDLRRLLRRLRIGSARDLRTALGVSQATLSRLLAQSGSEVVKVGRGRRVRYALARAVRGFPRELPLYRIDVEGRGHPIGELRALVPEGFALPASAGEPWPLPGEMGDGYFEGLPYFLFDARPQGFLGRALARRRAAELNVADDPTRWSDDDVVAVLVLAGEDLPGDLVLGEPAYERLLERMSRPKPALSDAEIERAYPQLADAVLKDGVPASSAGGELPKFTTTRASPRGLREVIVKFSAAEDTAAARRWSDLLVAESLAAASGAGPAGETVECQIHRFAGRTFLEVERFDRVGAWGRKPACTLSAIDAALLGLGDARWDRAARALADAGLVDAETRERLLVRWCFGSLIANSDMHAGNVAFHPVARRLELSPAYDMLPMRYAPSPGGEVPAAEFDPRLPLPEAASAWRIAAPAAIRFWETVARHELVSAGFRDVCRRNADRVSELLAGFGG